MTPTKDPRCPKHPDREVYVAMRGGLDVLRWDCSICNRPLGVASLSLMSMGDRGAGSGRRTPSQMADAAIDWEWLFDTADRRRAKEST